MTIQPQCLTCKHFVDDGTFGCKAFPFIPDNILLNKVLHDHKIEGQTGNYLYKRDGDKE